MDRLRALVRPSASYTPLEDDVDNENHALMHDSADDAVRGSIHNEASEPEIEDAEFLWFNYAIFMLLGVAMLWAW
jgi:hypothetical protein